MCELYIARSLLPTSMIGVLIMFLPLQRLHRAAFSTASTVVSPPYVSIRSQTATLPTWPQWQLNMRWFWYIDLKNNRVPLLFSLQILCNNFLSGYTRFICGISISFPKVETNWSCMNEETDKKTRKPKSDARISGEIATYVLLFLAVFTGLLVFIAS